MSCSRRAGARGVGDAQAADLFEAFDEWEAGLWEALAKVRSVLDRVFLLVGVLMKGGGEQEYNIELDEKPAVVSGITMTTVDDGKSRASSLRQPDADLGKVVENRLLTSPNAPAKRHLGECFSFLVQRRGVLKRYVK